LKQAALTVLWSAPGAIAIDKPAGLAAIPGRGETDSVLERVARDLGLPDAGEADPRVRVVHRLDKDTTGVMLFATDRATQQHFSHQFQNNTIHKEYLALVRGKPIEQSGEIDAPLAPHPTSPRRMAVVKHGGRPAKTAWRVEESFRGFALLRCFPKTGKTHQIRVHLAHIGLPLAIDPLYGSGEGILLSTFKRGYRTSRGEEERPLIDRLTLHAHRLTFLARDGASVAVESPLPKDFRAVLTQLRRNAR
jgi:23S rRNA pseudouridine955/2504/2580 synthase/23S rRNA pseudouridine1911/1915/1917 synthase